MADWFTPAEIVAAAGGDLPTTIQSLNRLIERQGWRRDESRARIKSGRGGGFEYHASLLPSAVQLRLGALPANSSRGAPPSVGCAAGGEIRESLWARFEALPEKYKAEARRRLAVLELVDQHRQGGINGTAAVRLAAAASGVSVASLYNWQGLTCGHASADRLAALAPNWTGGTARRDADARAYDVLKSDFLRPEGPAFSVCYRRAAKLAKRNGWPALPSPETMRRHLAHDVPEAAQVLAREGRDAAKKLYPAQTRTKMHMHAMQWVNMDGHKLDVFAKLPDGRIIRPMLIGIQDIYSGKLLAWRLAESESKEAVRLVIGDMVERHGIPATITCDNGRAFASKQISGGTANRYRFKVREEDPQGLLVTLGVGIHWTEPYAGQSKPIERVWLEMAEVISKHPVCAGAYTGNRPDAKPENYGSRAIAIEKLRAHAASEIADHNARPGRQSETANGRSLDETFAASLAEPSTVITSPTEGQKALWLLAAERIRAAKGNGEIRFMGNRYWTGALTGHANRDVTVRFDPDNLKQPLRIYDAQDRFLCAAPCIDTTGFDDADAARTHARNRRAYVKAQADIRDLHVKLSADELARMMAAGTDTSSEPQEPVRPAVTRIAVKGGAQGLAALLPPLPQEDEDAAASRSFGRGLYSISGGKV